MNRALGFILGGSTASLVLLAGTTAPVHAAGVDITAGDAPTPAKLVNNNYQVVWDGSYSDLLAADALAACWTTQKASATDPVDGNEADGLISSLMGHMTTASCKTTCSITGTTGTEN